MSSKLLKMAVLSEYQKGFMQTVHVILKINKKNQIIYFLMLFAINKLFLLYTKW